jgi:orotidine-5'-phosphate decarboxylase
VTDTERNFVQLLEKGWAADRFVSVGLDGGPSRLPSDLQQLDMVEAVVEFHRRIIEATAHLAVAYKPQIAGYEAMGPEGVIALIETIDLVRTLAPEIPVILDAKRADIGDTNEKYIDAIFGIYGADAVTVHPYLGPEAMTPFTDLASKGVFVLCRNSNPGAGHYQDLLVGEEQIPLYQYVARDVADNWNHNGNCGLVVGATYPEEMKEVRALVGRMPILVPGIGAQGGDVDATVRNGLDDRGAGLLLFASRSLLYAYEKHDGLSVQDATRTEIEALHAQIMHARG